MRNFIKSSLIAVVLSTSLHGFSQNLINSYIHESAPAASYDADYQAVLDEATLQGYTLPSLAERDAQNAVLEELKTQGVWDSLAVFMWMKDSGDIDFKSLNWKSPDGTDAFITDTGFTSSTTGILGDGGSTIRITFDSSFMDPFSQSATAEIVTEQTGSFSNVFVSTGTSTTGGIALQIANAATFSYIGSNPSTSARINVDFTGTGVYGLTMNTGGDTIEAWYDGVEDLGELDTGNTPTGTVATELYIFSTGATKYDGELGFFAFGGAYDQAALYTAVTINN